MASKKNRRSKANRKSPNLKDRALVRWRTLSAWISAHRWHSLVIAFGLLFAVSLFGGYLIAERFDPVERRTSSPRYARIEDIPGLPRYEESEPGQHPTIEEKPRPRPAPQVAAPHVAALAPSEQAAWRRNAVPFRDLNSKPLVAIVIDDVGLDRPRSKRAWELPGPLTMSFLPYAKDLREQAKAARAHGNELMLHLPMEPSGRADPGPNALLVSLTDAELKQRVATALDSFDGYVGVNNHMGSRFTTFRPGMETVLRQFKGRGLMFLDSRTTAQSVGDQLAQEMGVPSIVRHVFLDDDESLESLLRSLSQAESVARRQGFVVAIGHPHEATLQALGEWLPGLKAKGLALPPASAVLRKGNGWD